MNEARQIAGAFGHDCYQIDVTFNELRVLQGNPSAPSSGVPASPALASAAPPAPVGSDSGITQSSLQTNAGSTSEGQMLLEKARLELRRGDTANARRMTEAAVTNCPDVKVEAFALLRSIDAEEFNQKRLSTNRAFLAAVSAYNRHEYAQTTAMLAALDTRLLDPALQVRLREISMTPEMAALSGRNDNQHGSDVVRTGATEPVLPVPGAVGKPDSGPPAIGGAGDVGRARATDASDGGLLDLHKQKQLVLMDAWRQKGLDAQREAAEKFRTGQHDDAIAILQGYLSDLEGEKLDTPQYAQLKRPVDARISHYRLLKAQKDLATGAVAARTIGQDKVNASRKAEEMKRANVDKLMKEFNALFKEGKYLEAENMAMKAADLDPDNGVISAAVYMARQQRRVIEYKNIKDGREEMVLKGLNNAEDEGPAGVISEGEVFDKERWERARKRQPLSPITLSKPNEKEKAIMRRLSTPVSLSFEGAPLKAVINELRDINGINIVIDDPALQEAGIDLASPISIKLDQVSLKSALNLILNKVHLTHVIKDEALQITTEEHAKGKLVTTTYQVADLVIPVENFGDVRALPPPLYAPTNGTATQPPTPVTPGPFSLGGGAPWAPRPAEVRYTAAPAGSSSNSSSGTPMRVERRSANNTAEDQLIKLITSTIQPKSWSEMGGPGTIDYHPLTMALVINQAAGHPGADQGPARRHSSLAGSGNRRRGASDHGVGRFLRADRRELQREHPDQQYEVSAVLAQQLVRDQLQ